MRWVFAEDANLGGAVDAAKKAVSDVTLLVAGALGVTRWRWTRVESMVESMVGSMVIDVVIDVEFMEFARGDLWCVSR